MLIIGGQINVEVVCGVVVLVIVVVVVVRSRIRSNVLLLWLRHYARLRMRDVIRLASGGMREWPMIRRGYWIITGGVEFKRYILTGRLDRQVCNDYHNLDLT